jgi:hypothetical protein
MTHMVVSSVHFARLLTAALSLRAAYIELSFIVSVLKASNFEHYLLLLTRFSSFILSVAWTPSGSTVLI